jgi:hypothetical protein
MTRGAIVLRLASGLVLAGVAVLLGATDVGAGSSALSAGNLLQNPGGEIGPAVTRNDTLLPVQGWEIGVMPEVTTTGAPDSGFTQARYGSHNYFPTSAVSAAIGGGKSFLFAGPYQGQHVAHTSAATQTIDVAGAAADIDTGGVRACLSGYLGGSRNWNQYTISATLELLSADGGRLGQLRIGPVTSIHRKNQTTLLRRAASRPVPRDTRQLRLVLTGTSTTGGPTYGYADNLVVGLTKGACEPVLAVRCAGGALVASVTPSSVLRTQRVRFVVKGGERTKQAQDRRAPYTARFTMAGLTGRLTVTATVTAAGSGPLVITKVSRRC